MAKSKKYFEGTGRRKRSIARARIYEKSNSLTDNINKKKIEDYFPTQELLNIVTAPFRATDTNEKINYSIKVKGGGIRGQAEAIRLAISRALVKYNEDFYRTLKDLNYLTRDSRKKERKKAGLKKARRAPQWQKR